MNTILGKTELTMLNSQLWGVECYLRQIRRANDDAGARPSSRWQSIEDSHRGIQTLVNGIRDLLGIEGKPDRKEEEKCEG